MNLFKDVSIALAFLGCVGQWFDGFTTYQGVKKFGPGIEGDTGWLAQWLVHNSSLLLFFKPLVFGISFGALVWIGPATDGGGYAVASMLGIAAALMGAKTAVSNNQVNNRPK